MTVHKRAAMAGEMTEKEKKEDEMAKNIAEKMAHVYFDKDMHILDHHVKKERPNAQTADYITLNRIILFTWPLFSLFLLTQPWVSNWANNRWAFYSADYTVHAANGAVEGTYRRSGLCTVPAHEMHCTDGQNFTELALKYRGAAFGCGCGQGILGEGLCPMTSYGHTLSDFVSTAPGLGGMLGLGFFPLLGAYQATGVINKMANPTEKIARWNMYSLIAFQLSYIAWGVCSACVFPTGHAVLTVIFLACFLEHWITTAMICLAKWGLRAVEAKITFSVALFCIVLMGLGAIPRILLTINAVTGRTTGTLPNLNRADIYWGIGPYAFWFAEAAALSATFGVYPMMLIAFCHPKKARKKPIQFAVFYSDADANAKKE